VIIVDANTQYFSLQPVPTLLKARLGRTSRAHSDGNRDTILGGQPPDEHVVATFRVVFPIAFEKQNVFFYRYRFVDWMHCHSGALGRHQYPKTGNGLLQRPNHGQPD
jgi:hypothetical protein